MPRKEKGAITPARNTSAGVQGLLLLDIWARCMIWALAMSATLLVLSRMQVARSLSWDSLSTWSGAWHFCTTVTNLFLLFNIAYVVVLFLIRLLLPRPKPGVYKFRGKVNGNLILAAVLAILTKARFYPPFPGIFVAQITNIVPFRWLFNWKFGPNSQSPFFLDPMITDPWGVTIGKNVTLGLGATITAHLQEKDYVMVDYVVIEDDAVIGAYAGIGCGVHIKRGAFIEPFAAVRPGTIVGEGELWGGVPARKKGLYRGGTGMSQTLPDAESIAAVKEYSNTTTVTEDDHAK
jgi:acetyltransferase-like isoleucine patch superfamily enzyme